ncbi:IS110 family transposase [Pseudarthrobacter sp. N5]|uniref:IS110 family transposase n=1 Tax=Pseudarthrobacter sp. N5 TaxID=3418416 RepID=UPI003CF224CA
MTATIIGIDPHKESWTAVAVDPRGQKLAAVRAPVTAAGYRQLRRFADRFPDPAWAVEGAYGLGASLSALLSGDGVTVWDVPAKLAARVRVLSTGHSRKSDEDDALSVAVAATTSTKLRPVQSDAAASELKVLTEHRDDLVGARTQTVNRLHAIMNLLVMGGAPRNLTADAAAALLRRVRPIESLTATRRLIAADLVAEIRRLDKRITTATAHITTRVTDTQSTLTAIQGIGQLTAGKILARTGTVTRFATEAHFAAYAGVAPREVSSGDVVRHRLSRGGDRQLNYTLHTIALTQISMRTSPGRVFYDRKRSEGKSSKEALRALKRRLATVVFRRMIADLDRQATGPAGHQGTTQQSGVTGSHPDTGSFGKVTHRTRRNQA